MSRKEYMREYRAKQKQNTTEASKLVAEIKKSYAEKRRLIEAAMKTLNPGTKVYLDHVTALTKLDQTEREELVKRGLVTKDLGVAAAPGWKFVCILGRSGTVTTVEVKPGQAEPKSVEIPDRSTEDLRIIAELDADFGDSDSARK